MSFILFTMYQPFIGFWRVVSDTFYSVNCFYLESFSDFQLLENSPKRLNHWFQFVMQLVNFCFFLLKYQCKGFKQRKDWNRRCLVDLFSSVCCQPTLMITFCKLLVFFLVCSLCRLIIPKALECKGSLKPGGTLL